MHDEHSPNGDGRPLPAVTVGWDAFSQTVQLTFNGTEFRTWDFVLAVLDMAKQAAEQKKREAQLVALQHAARQEAMAQQVVRSLKH